MFSVTAAKAKYVVLLLIVSGLIASCGNNAASSQHYNTDTSKLQWCGVYTGVLSKKGLEVQLKLRIRSNGFYSLEQKALKVNSSKIIVSYHWKPTRKKNCICLYKMDGEELSTINLIDTTKLEIVFKDADEKTYLFKKLQ